MLTVNSLLNLKTKKKKSRIIKIDDNNKLTSKFEMQMKAYKVDGYIKEYKFSKTRKWRIDYFFPKVNIGIEIDGGVFSAGRHVRGIGYHNDCDKANSAIANGIKLFRFTTKHVNDGEAIQFILKELCQK